MRFMPALACASFCAVSRIAQADLPSVPPQFLPDLTQQSVPLPRQIEPVVDGAPRERATRLLRSHDDVEALAMGSAALAYGAMLTISGGVLATTVTWRDDCPICVASGFLLAFGVQTSVIGAFVTASYGSLHRGRGHRRRVDALVHAIEHASPSDASDSHHARVAAGASLVAASFVLVGGGITLFAIGHQSGFDDQSRALVATTGMFIGSWLGIFGFGALAAKWPAELAVTPTRGGASFAWTGTF